jgi:hypothetical protein
MMDHQPGGAFLVPVRQSFWYQDLALATATAFVLLDTRLSFVGLNGEPVGKGASADVFSLIVWGGEALIRVQRALLRGIDMLPGEDRPPKQGPDWSSLLRAAAARDAGGHRPANERPE